MAGALIALAAIDIAFLSASFVQAQPASCKSDYDCDSGFYCEGNLFYCRECLSCENLKREPARFNTKCIKSVTDCGACIEGLVEDRSGDVNSVCVPPDIRTDEDGLPSYVWVAVVLGLFLLVVLVFGIVFLLRNTHSLKVLNLSTNASVLTPGSRHTASAPELPPPYYESAAPLPYNPHYTSPPARDAETPVRDDDMSWPFIKPPLSPEPVGGAEREAAGHQAARVYKPPWYVRPPPHDNDESESTFPEHDEDTMESTWTPTPCADQTDANGNAVTSGPLATLAPSASHASAASHAPAASHASAASHTSHALATSHESPVTHTLFLREDSNNNRNPNEPSVSGSSANGSGSAPVIINLVQNFNALQQHNDVTF